MKAKFVSEALAFDTEKDEIVNTDLEKEIKPTRFLIHVSNPLFRESIYEKGLIPKDAGKQWSKIAKFISDDKILYKNSIFAVLFKDSIDVYDLKGALKRAIFPLPLLVDNLMPEDTEKYDDLILKLGEDYSKELREIKNSSKSERQKNLFLSGLGEKYENIFSEELDNFLRIHSKIDVWLIDTKGLPNTWYEDYHSGWEDGVYTHEKIPSYFIELIKADNENLFDKI